VHDEIVVECDEADAKKAEAWLKRATVAGMDGVLNAPDIEGPACRPRWRSRAAGAGPGKGRRAGGTQQA
jgi:hypothetical protein